MSLLVLLLPSCSAWTVATPARSNFAAQNIKAARAATPLLSLPDGQRHFLHVDDLTGEEVREVLELAKAIKPIIKAGNADVYKPFIGQTLAMIFCKPSTRTRVSFESGFFRLGGHAMCLGEEIGIGKREATKDISRVLAGYNDLVMARLFAHKDIIELAKYSNIPVVNGLTDHNHPCQIMADALTIEEVLGSIEGKKVVYSGDGNNIVNSWLELACIVNFDFVWAGPKGYEPDMELVKKVQASGAGTATLMSDPMEAVKGADAVYADVWASMQNKDEAEERARVLKPYQVNEALMAATGKPNTIFLHCLPAERNKETTDGVMESKNSYIFQQAENRMHAQNAIMVWAMGAKRP